MFTCASEFIVRESFPSKPNEEDVNNRDIQWLEESYSVKTILHSMLLMMETFTNTFKFLVVKPW